MAFAEVGGGTQRAGGSGAATDTATAVFPANVAADSLLIVAGAAWAALGAPASIAVTDTLATAYTVDLTAAVPGSNIRLFIARGLAPSAGACTVTVDPAGLVVDFSFSIDEFSGSHATPLDVDGGSSSGTDAAPADALTTLTANDLIIGVMAQDGATKTLTPGADYTQIGENETNAAMQCHNAVFRIVTTAQAYTVDWTMASSSLWGAYTAAFREAAAAANAMLLRMMEEGLVVGSVGVH